jgi:hypothetical protein
MLLSHTGPSRPHFTPAVRRTGPNAPETRTSSVKRQPQGAAPHAVPVLFSQIARVMRVWEYDMAGRVILSISP